MSFSHLDEYVGYVTTMLVVNSLDNVFSVDISSLSMSGFRGTFLDLIFGSLLCVVCNVSVVLFLFCIRMTLLSF